MMTVSPLLDRNTLLADTSGDHFSVVLKRALTSATEQLNSSFVDGICVGQLMEQRAACVDEILLALWIHNGLDNDDCDLIAVGGYGRGELHPFSDIDLLILTGDDFTPNDGLQNFLTALWDLSLDIGHSVRTVEQTLTLAAEDLTVVTALMETRLLLGDSNRYAHIKTHSTADHMWDSQKFYGRKWEEQIIRHKKFADTEYSLEPNIKDGPGGLRDIQILRWIALRHFKTADFRELQRFGIISVDEATSIIESERYLQAVRWTLHVLAGREEDRLLFDHQRTLASEAGFEDGDDALAVEQYMQLYYQHSMNISCINELLMQAFEEEIWDTFSLAVPQAINERFQLRGGHLEPINGDSLFFEQPSALLEVFAILAEQPSIIGVTVSCIRGIRKARDLIDDNFRADSVNRKLFVRLMNSEHKLTSQLRRMNQQGILERYLPNWKGIVGRMQHDLFHIYTVDAHTINVVKNMRLLAYPGGVEKHPLASEVIQRLPQLDLLYTAGLFHDIAKGRGGDHSTLGAVDAKDYCERHGYNEQDSALVAWLVENHLLMSSTSQRKDISDPDVINEFALTVGNENYLNYLFVLTVADINATNPTLWTSWRASLLRQLYTETRRALRRGLEKENQREAWVSSTRRLAMSLLTQTSYNEEEILPRWKSLGEDYFLRETAVDIAWHTEAMLNHGEGPLVQIKDTNNRRFEGGTQIFIYTPKQKNQFARTTALLAQLNLSVQDARIYSAPGGYTMDTYIVLDADNQPIKNDNSQHHDIKLALEEGLKDSDGKCVVNKLVPRVLKHFSMPTMVQYSPSINDTHTVLEVTSPDRAGMLAIIASILSRYEVELNAAKITTLGERVEDVLYITTLEGKAIEDDALLEEIADMIKQELDQQNRDEP